MKLDKNCTVWINCRTQQEQEEMLDIFEAINATWNGSAHFPRGWKSHKVPMHYLLERNKILHGGKPVSGREDYVNRGIVIEAKDCHNQWVSIKRRDK